MAAIQASIRGVPEWLIRDYLAEIGAAPAPGDESEPRMVAERWSASWTSHRAQVPGSRSFRLTQFDIVFAGEPGAVDDAHERFMKKAQRGGG